MVDNAYSMLRELKEYAKENDVPIMQDEGIDFLTTFVIKHQITNVLEIGTAIGFSAISMALANPKLKVTSIERDEARYLEAVKNIKKFDLEDRITLLFNDALEVKLEDEYDLIFIDAAKAQYRKFFEKFSPLLKDKGVIISDNIELLDLQRLTDSKKSKKLVEKMKFYREFLSGLVEYESEFLSIGDGFAVTRKKFN